MTESRSASRTQVLPEAGNTINSITGSSSKLSRANGTGAFPPEGRPDGAAVNQSPADARWIEYFVLLAETAGELLQSREPQKAVEKLCRKVMACLDCHVFFNYLVDEKAGKLHLNACGGVPADAVEQLEWLDFGVAICGCVARDGRRIIAEHIAETPDPRTVLFNAWGVRACASHPLLSKDGKVLGTLTFGTGSRDVINKDELALMKAAADEVAIAISRMRDEEALREINDRFLNVLNNSIDIAYRRDLRTDAYDYMSPAIEKITGYSVREFMGLDMDAVLRIMHPDDIPRVDKVLDRVMTTPERSAVVEYRVKGKDGGYRWLADNLKVITDENGVPRYRVGVVRDATERKRNEEALRESEKKYRDLLETANSIIIRWTPDGILRYINDYGLAFFRYRRDEIVGRSVRLMIPDRDFLGGEDMARLAEYIANDLATYRSGELESITKTGERRWVMWTNKAVRSDTGDVLEILSIGNDITGIKKAEEVLERDKESLERLVKERTDELLQAQTELLRAKRMSDIGRLAATVAHEIRNPLSAIRTAAYNIRRKAGSGALARHIDTIDKKVFESDTIIRNLLSFTRIKSVNIERLDPGELLRDTAATVSAKYANWDVRLEERIECRQGDTVEADPAQFRMLIGNILDNAYQALPEKRGTITMTAVRRQGGTLKIAVADTGSGIAEEDMEKIFEPFYTTKSRGTGLGLAVCREIVEMHGGKIEVQSSSGAGTVVSVTLPARRRPLADCGQTT